MAVEDQATVEGQGPSSVGESSRHRGPNHCKRLSQQAARIVVLHCLCLVQV